MEMEVLGSDGPGPEVGPPSGGHGWVRVLGGVLLGIGGLWVALHQVGGFVLTAFAAVLLGVDAVMILVRQPPGGEG